MIQIIMFLIVSLSGCNAFAFGKIKKMLNIPEEQMKPVQVLQPIEFNFEFDIQGEANIDFNYVEQIKKHIVMNLMSYDTQNFMNVVAEKIALSVGLDGEAYHENQMKFSVSESVGNIKVYSILANINKNHVNIKATVTEALQIIPKVYKTETVCKPTGGRRYVIAGPRNNVCNSVRKERGINPDEIQIVNKRLLEALETIRK